jgi:hypothetical protein
MLLSVFSWRPIASTQVERIVITTSTEHHARKTALKTGSEIRICRTNLDLCMTFAIPAMVALSGFGWTQAVV